MDRRAIALATGALLTAAGAFASEELRNHQALPSEEVNLAQVPVDSGTFQGVELEVDEQVLRQWDAARNSGKLKVLTEPTIITLDDQHNAGNIAYDAYQQRRTELKEKFQEVDG